MDTNILAEMVLAAHLVYAGFVVLGYLAVTVGAWRDWGWVRNRLFRLAHLCAIGFVAVEALAGVVCPLTLLEHRLRGMAGDPQWSFMGRLMQTVLYYQAPPWVFTLFYLALVLLAGWLWFKVPPRPKR